MRIFLLLIASSFNVLGIGIQTEGLGATNQWNIKTQTGNGNVNVNVDDDNEFSIEDNSDDLGSFDNTHLNTTPNENGSVNYIGTSSYANTYRSVFSPPDGSSPTPQGGGRVDTDDDVPMLTEIKAVLEGYKEKLEQLAEQKQLLALRADLNATRGDLTDGNQTRKATLADIAKRVTDIQGQIYIEGQGTKQTQLSDLYQELVKLNDGNVTENNFTEVTAETITAQKQQVDDSFDSLNQLEENFEVSAPSTLEPHEASVMLNWKFLEGDISFDLLNIADASGISIPSLKQAGGYVKMFLGWVISIMFIVAMKNLALDVLKNIPKQTTSAPVTNWSLGGFSVGALLSKSAYLGALVTFIIAVAGGLVIVNDEAKLLGDIGSESSSIGTYLASLIDGNGFMSEAFRYLLIFVPVGSIFVTIGTYYKFKIVTWLMINGAVLSMRAVT